MNGFDWNGNGRHDCSDSYVDWKLSNSNSSKSYPNSSSKSSNRWSLRHYLWLIFIILYFLIDVGIIKP